MTINICYKTHLLEERLIRHTLNLQQITNNTYHFTFTGSVKRICYFVTAAVKKKSVSSAYMYTKHRNVNRNFTGYSFNPWVLFSLKIETEVFKDSARTA